MARTKTSISNDLPEETGIESAPQALPSTKAAMAELDRRVRYLETKKRENHKFYMAEEKVRVSISPFYRPYFGNVMSINVNGVHISVPCDGKSYAIPKTFADVVTERIWRVDMRITKRNRQANVRDNFERYPGELPLT